MNVLTPLVRGGADAYIAEPDGGHGLVNVYSEMLAQCTRAYSGLPDARTLTMSDIRFFYDWLRADIRRATAPKPKSK